MEEEKKCEKENCERIKSFGKYCQEHADENFANFMQKQHGINPERTKETLQYVEDKYISSNTPPKTG